VAFLIARGTGTVGVSPEINPLSAMFRVLLFQVAAGLIMAVAGQFSAGTIAAYSALLGGLICVVPNTFLALRMFAGSLVGDPRRALTATYVGAAGKLLLTAALFAVVFWLVRPLRPGWLFAGFIAAQGVVLVSLMSPRFPGQSTTG
jgi:ATP synthase protein I